MRVSSRMPNACLAGSRLSADHAGTLNLLTIALTNKGCLSQAATFISRVTAFDGAPDISHFNYVLLVKQPNQSTDALRQFSQAPVINPTVSGTFNNQSMFRRKPVLA
jgi:hypothetical protein